jgi:uncharacterized membrane protein YeaQ/YmgE (transglycosylase-associated protein family)
MRNIIRPPAQRARPATPVEAPGWLVWLRWLVANLLGGVVGYLAGSLLAPMLGSFPTLIAGIMGAIVGIAQWQTLRDFVPSLNGSLWVAFTALGFGLAAPMIQLTGQAMAWTSRMVPMWEDMVRESNSIRATLELIIDWRYPLAFIGAALTGAAAGLALGIAQVWVLRRYVYDTWIWIAGNIAGGIVGTLLGLMIALLLYPYFEEQYIARVVLILFLVPSGVFLLSSLVTGGALAMLRTRLKAPEEGQGGDRVLR